MRSNSSREADRKLLDFFSQCSGSPCSPHCASRGKAVLSKTSCKLNSGRGRNSRRLDFCAFCVTLQRKKIASGRKSLLGPIIKLPAVADQVLDPNKETIQYNTNLHSAHRMWIGGVKWHIWYPTESGIQLCLPTWNYNRAKGRLPGRVRWRRWSLLRPARTTQGSRCGSFCWRVMSQPHWWRTQSAAAATATGVSNPLSSTKLSTFDFGLYRRSAARSVQ